MRNKLLHIRNILAILSMTYSADCFASDFNMEVALSDVREKCASLQEDLEKIKNMATANTVVSAVGTGTGVGALATGIAKKQTDDDAEEIEINLEQLYEIESKNPDFATYQDYDDFLAYLPDDVDISSVLTKYSSLSEAIDSEEKELARLNAKSKNLGNWRTGLMAGTTATAIAGTAIAANNRAGEDFIEKINSCIASVDKLNESVIANKTMNKDVAFYQQIVNACQDYKYVDLSVINKHALGALVSSAIAMTTGITGTTTSAVANSKNIREDNTDKGKAKEKALNTSSNVLAAGAGISSAVSTVFSALQIKEAKKIIDVANRCSTALKRD